MCQILPGTQKLQNPTGTCNCNQARNSSHLNCHWIRNPRLRVVFLLRNSRCRKQTNTFPLSRCDNSAPLFHNMEAPKQSTTKNGRKATPIV